LAVVGVFAGVDALRSSEGEPPAAEASGTEALTKTPAETDADLESSAQLRSQEVKRLRPGRVRTDERAGYVVTFRIPREAPAWYGFQDDFGFQLGRNLQGQTLGSASGAITVYLSGYSLAQAVRTLEQLDVRFTGAVHIGRHSGREYIAPPQRSVSLQALGLQGVLEADGRLILVGVRRQTFVVERAWVSPPDRAEVNRVLTSFRFLPNADRPR
jgi:hypothetical protein